MNKLQSLPKTGIMDSDLLRYLPGMLPLVYHRMIYAVRTKKILADLTYENLQLWNLILNFLQIHA